MHICENFPCHEIISGFSCEYCYCPIYEKDCKAYGGNPKFLNGKTEVIKDCSECILPHKPEFEKILTEIKKDVIIKI